MSRLTKFNTILLILICLSHLPVMAKTRALLIGINYQHLPKNYQLEGPKNDIAVFKRLLQDKWEIKDSDIKILEEQQATKKNIISALDELVQQSKAGDHFIFYFSGHGTSKHDSSFGRSLVLSHNTGALVPVDFTWQSSVDELSQNLIVGRYDIKPRFKILNDKGVSGIAIIDACFSANAIRSSDLNRYRFLPLTKGLNTKGLAVKNTSLLSKTPSTMPQKKIDWDYPYNRIIQLAAAGKHEKAQDIGHDKAHKTHDGKPHGAFSDSLFRVLKNEQLADVDNDNKVTYKELYYAVKQSMSDSQYTHKPVMLPKSGYIIKEKIYPTQATQVSHLNENNITASDSETFRFAGDESILKKALLKQNNLVVDQQNFDFKVEHTGYSYQLWTPYGDKLIEVDTEAGIIEVILLQPLLRKIRQSRNSLQNFDIHVQMVPDDVGETYISGEHIQFYISSEQAGHLVVINITANGHISVLYPHEKGQDLGKQNNEAFSFKAKVSPPYGYEQVLVMAFKHDNEFYRHLLKNKNQVFKPGGEKYQYLINELLRDDEQRSIRHFSIMTIE